VGEDLLPGPEGADAGWTQHLVRGEGVEVTTERLYVHREVRRALSAVDQQQRTGAVRDFGDLGYGVHGAEDVADVERRDQLRPRADQPLQVLEVDSLVRRETRGLDDDPTFLGQQLPRDYVRVVLGDGDDHLIAGIEVRSAPTPRDEVDRLGRVADEHEAFRLGGADERSHRGPRSEEHTSELQSRENLVCRLLLEKKKT